MYTETQGRSIADGRWRLHPRVALRPEPFGALAYHYGNRRLNFLRSPDLVAVVEALGDEPTVDATLDACAIAPRRRPSFERALAALARSDFLVPLDGDQPDQPDPEPTVTT
ncbi:MAG: mycofactocin biosynthesis chaperone MftB [Actinomycetota bacterium]